MPRSPKNLDAYHRPRRVTTAREIRQSDDIAALKTELRTLRRELAKARRPSAVKTADLLPQDYDAFLDHIGETFTALIDKGRDLHGTCPHCRNVHLPCISPLIEMERMDYAAGEYEALIFAPNRQAGRGALQR